MQLAARHGTMVDVLAPRVGDRTTALARDLTLIGAGTALVAGCAQVALPWSPVPLTGQTFAVLLVGGLLGFWRATAALTLYWLVGVVGVPVFSDATSGWEIFTGATGGYILGFILAAAVVGYLADRGWDRRVLTLMAALFIGNVLIYAVGLPWLAESNVGENGADFGWANAIDFGLVPFIGGDVAKLLLAAGLLPAGWGILQRFGLKPAERGPRASIG